MPAIRTRPSDTPQPLLRLRNLRQLRARGIRAYGSLGRRAHGQRCPLCALRSRSPVATNRPAPIQPRSYPSA